MQHTLAKLFTLSESGVSLIASSYDYGLVLLSFLVASIGSALVLFIATEYAEVTNHKVRLLVKMVGAAAFGMSVWSMHFIGMLAFSLSATVTYDVAITFLSILPAIAAGYFAIHWISYSRGDLGRLMLAGIVTGGGVGVMHYTGMLAMQMSARLEFNLIDFSVSIVAAIVLAILALISREILVRVTRLDKASLCLVGGSMIGMAITSMHYLGMRAARFVGDTEFAEPVPADDRFFLVLMVLLVIVAVLGFTFSGVLYERLQRVYERVNENLAFSLSATDVGLFHLDLQSGVVTLSENARRLFDFPQEESPSPLKLSVLLDQIESDGLDQFTELVAQRSNLEDRLSMFWKLRLNNGQRRFLNVHTKTSPQTGLSGTISGVVIDVTELKQHEAELENFASILRAAADSADLYIYDENIDLSVGTALYRGSDTAEKPYVGQELFDIVPAALHQQLNEALDGDTECEIPLHFQHSESPKWVRLSVIKRYQQNDQRHRIVMSVDITDEVKLRVRIQDQVTELQTVLRKRNQLFGMIAHELRTPVASIAMMAEHDNSDWSKYRQDIQRNGRDLLNTIDDMRLLINPDLKRPVRPESFSVEEMNATVASSVASIVASTGLNYQQLNDIPDSERSVYYNSDTYRIRVAVTNLVRNGCLHSEGTDIWMTSRLYHAPEHRVYLEWSVVDNGIGIPADQIDRLFEAGERGLSGSDGTGYGLYIARGWIEEIGGEVVYRATPSGGSEFIVRVPLVNAEDQNVTPNHENAERPDLSNLNVLMVEDEAMLRLLGEKLLSGLVGSVTTAEDGVKGLAAFDPSFDLILTDYFMPQMSGVEMTKKIRQQGYKGVIIGVTAATIGEQQEELLAAGADLVLSKPLTARAFIDATAKLQVEGHFHT